MDEQIQRPSANGNSVIIIAPNLASGSHLGLADADDIAYSYKDNNGIIKKDKSVKYKLDELITLISDVNNILKDIKEQINNLKDSENIKFIPTGKTETTVADYLNSLVEKFNSIELKATSVNDQYTLISNAIEILNNINSIATNLKGTIDYNSLIIILPENLYDSTTAIPNTIYLCYDEI